MKLALTATFRGTLPFIPDILFVMESRQQLAHATEEAESTGMKRGDEEALSGHTQDKQLQAISLESVLEKRRLDQALNAKEFAVCAGVSYSTARCWFHLAGFPAFRGVIFWQDFVQWRAGHNGFKNPSTPVQDDGIAATVSTLPPRAAQLLSDA